MPFDHAVLYAHLGEIALAHLREERGARADPDAVEKVDQLRAVADQLRLTSHSGSDDPAAGAGTARSGNDRAQVSVMLTSKQVAAELRLSKRRVNQLAKSGELIGFKVGRWMFARGDVEQYRSSRNERSNGDPGSEGT